MKTNQINIQKKAPLKINLNKSKNISIFTHKTL